MEGEVITREIFSLRALFFYYVFLSFGFLGFFTFFLPLVPILLPPSVIIYNSFFNICFT
jgi:hypothetical protein